MDPGKVSAETLYRKYGFLINRVCLKILGSPEDARDALQAVFLKLLERYESISDKEKVVPWIFTAAKNHCYAPLCGAGYCLLSVNSRDAFARTLEARPHERPYWPGVTAPNRSWMS